MQKIIKKYGNSLIIKIDPDDRLIYNLKEGDIVKLDLKLIRRKKNANKSN